MSGNFPAIPVPNFVELRSLQPTYASVSHSLNTQRRTRNAQRWGFLLEYPSLTWDDIKPLMAFLLDQEGRAEVFDFELAGYHSTGTWGGSPNVDGASQTGTSISTQGWTASTLVVKAGDFVKFAGDDKIYMAAENLTSDGAGDGTLEIQPALISSPADTAVISTHTASSPLTWKVARLEDTFAVQRALGGRYEPFTIELAEDV